MDKKTLRYHMLLCSLCTMWVMAPDVAVSKELRTYISQIEQTGGWYITESAIVSGSDIKAGVVYALFESSHAHLVTILRDYSRYRELIPFISNSKVIKRHSDGAELGLKARILKGAIKLKSTVDARESRDSDMRTTFKLRKKKGNLKRLDATFTVEQLSPNRSIVRIELMLDPDVWYVRDGTLTEYNQVNARRIARALKKAILQRPAPPKQTIDRSSTPKISTPDAVPEATKPVPSTGTPPLAAP